MQKYVFGMFVLFVGCGSSGASTGEVEGQDAGAQTSEADGLGRVRLDPELGLEGYDAGPSEDAALPGAGEGGGGDIASRQDAGLDAEPDAGQDAGSNAGSNAGADAGEQTPQCAVEECDPWWTTDFSPCCTLEGICGYRVTTKPDDVCRVF